MRFRRSQPTGTGLIILSNLRTAAHFPARDDDSLGKIAVGDLDGVDSGRLAVKFRYGRDPLCWGCCLLYAVNSLGRDYWGWSGFSASYLNDFLLIPCALPLILWVHRYWGWRPVSAPPTIAETGGHLLVWSLVAEGWGPTWFAGAVRDPWDLLAYSLGAAAAMVWWHRDRWRGRLGVWWFNSEKI